MIDGVRGTRVLEGDEAKKYLEIADTFHNVANKYGFEYIKIPTLEKEELKTKRGRKYTSFWFGGKGTPIGSGGNAIHCFINNETGDIYKPASTILPAKHARGNLFSKTDGLEAFGSESPKNNGYYWIRYM